MRATNVDEVLTILDGIVAGARSAEDPRGYFAALYRQVTLEVRTRIVDGWFDDGPRMSRFDALFANRYFDAYLADAAAARCWRVAFDAVRSGQSVILQNLLLGINAHINLDLAVVTGQTFQGAALAGFHDDFVRINDILSSLIPRVRATIGQFSPLLGLLGDFGDSSDRMLDFSLDRARDNAWNAATLIAALPPQQRPLMETQLDNSAAVLGQLIARPEEPLATWIRMIRRTESKHAPSRIIAALDSIVA
ncbi:MULTISPECIES: DUF5995 family protein [Rhodococcus]|uniref:Uncharacterized protein n=2 Tax=Rhodococcus TaxID=1827 RepID=M3A2S5_9NOCA|nr:MULTISPECIES: DUF5995 family protein [Rhodococcus]EME66799.1 hypothetical protein G352_02644 [Rhodococcus ruber BKS 20-38]KOS54197.1 hypothetical protein Z051_21375 [Rhodococcus rhodochrous KG-21]